MAESAGLEPARPKSSVFKTDALPIMLTLQKINKMVRPTGIEPATYRLAYYSYSHRPLNSVVVWAISSPSQVEGVWSLRILNQHKFPRSCLEKHSRDSPI